MQKCALVSLWTVGGQRTPQDGCFFSGRLESVERWGSVRLVGSAFPPGFAQNTCTENTSSLPLRKFKAGVHGKVHHWTFFKRWTALNRVAFRGAWIQLLFSMLTPFYSQALLTTFIMAYSSWLLHGGTIPTILTPTRHSFSSVFMAGKEPSGGIHA